MTYKTKTMHHKINEKTKHIKRIKRFIKSNIQIKNKPKDNWVYDELERIKR